MNLVLTTAIQITEIQTPSGFVGSVELTLSVEDTRPYLASKSVQYSVDWGDGSPVEESERLLSPVGPVVLDHRFSPGTFFVEVTAWNFAVPQEDRAFATLTVVVEGQPTVTPLYDPVIFGPSMPLDQNWTFNFATDTKLLLSSARLLLATAMGERLMNPNYGTRLKQLLFNPRDQVTTNAIREELERAFTAQEPRAKVVDVVISSPENTRAVNVDLLLVSQLDQRQVKLSATFTP